jgi:hypothetical protein
MSDQSREYRITGEMLVTTVLRSVVVFPGGWLTPGEKQRTVRVPSSVKGLLKEDLTKLKAYSVSPSEKISKGQSDQGVVRIILSPCSAPISGQVSQG